MNDNFNFNDIFVFDLANNHQGNVEHGLNVIKNIGSVARKHDIRGVFKFQFRQLDSFIHASHKEGSSNKHIPRFISTRLSTDQYQILLDEVRAQNMIACCTPFDEESVDIIQQMNFDILKVASCCARDWPLLEKIAKANMPVIFSTGGLDLKHIDDLISFFDHKGVDHAIMHCVSIYPTPTDKCQLNQIDVLKNRYRDKVIGWSTHEDPNDKIPVQIAYAKGARMFERHVGIETEEIKLNAYSSTPEQIDLWIEAYKNGKNMCGETSRPAVTKEEIEGINSLKRGVYVKKDIKKDTVLTRDNIYFSMPYEEGQLSSGEWNSNIKAKVDLKLDNPILKDDVDITLNSNSQIIKDSIHEVKALLNEARIILNSEFDVEYSHHYGISEFRKVGAVIINCINREYCKKIIVQLPGQKHPAHYHQRKEETFQVLYGDLTVYIDGHKKVLSPGETCLVQPGVWHNFGTENGCIFEEVSTTHYNDDSFYKDKKINDMKRSDRKTMVTHWGRFEIDDKVDTK